MVASLGAIRFAAGVDAHPVPEKSGAAGSLETSSDHLGETWPVRGEQGFTCLRALMDNGENRLEGPRLVPEDMAGRCEQMSSPFLRHGTMEDYGIKSFVFFEYVPHKYSFMAMGNNIGL